ncbi:MAG TPA: RpiB/LacA/LacB family sugar-phosphate isomerase [Candidatus Nanoarchaeia archaeon]|nr:RpiB/LacA/LacB family sugar-phosphate isomerase [Candidatus Nanoarchaeia archaeon]
MKPTIVLGSDHAGFNLKEAVKSHLEGKGLRVKDMGAHSFNEQDDYPDFIIPAAKEVAKYPKSKGIIFGGSGQGEAIAANRIKGIRAALYTGHNLDIVKLSRTHNDSNILSLGARLVSEKEALNAIMLWLSTPFSREERHVRRIKKLDSLSR